MFGRLGRRASYLTQVAALYAASFVGVYIPSTGLQAAWGMQQLVSGYSGPLFKLRRSSDSAVQDFSAASGSQLPDYAAMATFRDAAGAANLSVVTIYDQSGGAANLTQATAGLQPSVDLTQMNANGCYPALFDGLATQSKMVAALATDRQNMSVAQAIDLETIGGQQACWETNDGVNAIQALGVAGRSFFYSLAGGQTFPTTVLFRSQLSAIGGTCSATERRMFYRETNIAVAAATAGTGTNFQIGAISGTSYKSALRFYGTAVYTALTTANMNTALDQFRTIFAIPTTFDRRVIFIGDSISAGQLATRLKNLQAQLTLNGTPEMFNIGTSGQTLASALAAKTSTTDILLAGAPYSGKTVLVIQGGINDLRASTSSTTLYTTATSFVTSAHTPGCKAILANILPDTEASWTGTMETQRLAYQTAVNGNAAAADATLDLANTATTMGALAAPNDTTLYADKLHPTTLGYSYISPTYSTAINAQLP